MIACLNDSTQHVYSTADVLNDSLSHAAANNSLEKVTALLDGGLDINSRDPSLSTALHCAILNNSSTMVHLLLSRGADTSLRDDWIVDEPNGFTVVETAARLGAIEN
jgi:ankyrin repeat protein